MSLLEDSSDDPEELRRQMEAREAAQNLGAVIGLAAGAVGAAAPEGYTQTGQAADETDAGVTPRSENWKKGIKHSYGKYQAASNA